MRMSTRSLLLVALAALAPALIHSQPAAPRPAAAVFEFELRLPGETLDGAALTEIFRTAFVQAGAFRVVERAQLDRVLAEQELQLAGLTETGAARAGALAGAAKVVMLSLSRVGSRYLAAARSVDATSGIVDAATTVSDSSLDGIVALLPELAYRLSGKTPLDSGRRALPVLDTIIPRIGAAFYGSVLGDRAAGDFSRVNDLAFEGLRLVVERYRGSIAGDPSGAAYGTAVTVSYREAAPGSRPEDALRALAREGNGLVFALGFMFAPSAATVAREFPRVRFVLVDGVPPGGDSAANLCSVMFKDEEGSFLAGALAALVAGETRGGKVGFMGGMDMPVIREFRSAFMAGAAAVDQAFKPGSTAQDAWVGDFSDPAKAEKLASAMYGGGVRIIFHAAGNSGAGVIRAAAAAGRLVIGVDYDQGLAYAGSADPKERAAAVAVASSMVKRYDEAVLRCSTAWLSAGLLPSGLVELGLADGCVGLARNAWNRALMDRFQPALDALEQRVLRGELAVPRDDATLEAFLKSLRK